MILLVGLGNPGTQYRNHRHNVGFMVLDRVHSRVMASEWREKFNGLAGRAVMSGLEATLLKPQTFMNISGRAVLKAVTQHGIKPAEITVVHDDLDLPYGEVRVKVGGGHGGHNGLRDISAAIGTEYLRVRIGIGRPTVGTVEAYVLSGFTKDEQLTLESVIDRAADAVECIVKDGVTTAMNRFNPKTKK